MLRPVASTLLVCTSLCTSLAAQNSVTSPKGFDSKEGNTIFYASTNRRYQSLDNTNTGSVLPIKYLALRRDTGSASTAGASTVDATLYMGEADMAVVNTDMDSNFLPGTRKTVFPKAQVNWPDWSSQTPSPGPFDLRFPFAGGSIFLYLGNNALVWDLTLENGTNTGNRFDRDFTSPSRATGSSLGSGCSGFSLTSYAQSNGPGGGAYSMRFGAFARSGPANQPIALSLALKDANATVPGFCATLHAVPLAVVPLGVSDASGNTSATYLQTKFNSNFNGAQIYSQAFGPGAPLALSNGSSVAMPTSSATTGHEASYIWRSVGGTTTFLSAGGSYIAQLGL